MLKVNSGRETISLVGTFSKITFSNGIRRVKLARPKKTANKANTAYLGTNREYGLANASSLKYVFI
jgi:hypothetical protein